MGSPLSIPVPGSPALEPGEERDSGGQINQKRLPGGRGAAAGSKNTSIGLPHSWAEGFEDFSWKKDESLEKRRMVGGRGWGGGGRQAENKAQSPGAV